MKKRNILEKELQNSALVVLLSLWLNTKMYTYRAQLYEVLERMATAVFEMNSVVLKISLWSPSRYIETWKFT